MRMCIYPEDLLVVAFRFFIKRCFSLLARDPFLIFPYFFPFQRGKKKPTNPPFVQISDAKFLSFLPEC